MSESVYGLRHVLRLAGDDAVRLACSVNWPDSCGTQVALVTEAGWLLLVLLRPDCGPPLVRQVALPAAVTGETGKRVTCLCLDPIGCWVLLGVEAGALYVLPLAQPSADGADPLIPVDDGDLLVVPAGPHPLRPSALAWWTHESRHYAVVGGTQGELELVDLSTATRAGGTYVRCGGGGIGRLHVAYTDGCGACWLLIGCADGQQWRLLLEDPAVGYVLPLDGTHAPSMHGGAGVESTAAELLRVRLTSLKQYSREKLGSLQQRWTDTRRLMRRDSQPSVPSSAPPSDPLLPAPPPVPTRMRKPEAPARAESVTGLVGDMPLWHYRLATAGDVMAGYYQPLNSLTVYKADLQLPPLSIHQLPPASVSHLLLTERVIFLSDVDGHRLLLMSNSLTQSASGGGEQEFNADSVISILEPPLQRRPDVEDRLLCLLPCYRVTSPLVPSAIRTWLDDGTVEYTDAAASRARATQTPLDACLLVTRRGLIVCKPQLSPESACLQAAFASDTSPRVLAHFRQLFGCQDTWLLEQLADMKLGQRQFNQALVCFRMAKLSPPAVMAKLAALGFSSQLLHYVGVLSRSVRINDDPCLLADVSMMALVESALRSTMLDEGWPELTLLERFLRVNQRYDTARAMRTCLLARLHSSVTILIEERGQHAELLNSFFSDEQDSDGSDLMTWEEGRSLLLDERLRAVLFLHPVEAGRLMRHLLMKMPYMSIAEITKLISLTDPLSVELRPRTHPLLFGSSTSSPSSASETHVQCSSLQTKDLVDVHIHALLQALSVSGESSAAPSVLSINPSQDSCCGCGEVGDDVTTDQPDLSASDTHAGVCWGGRLWLWRTEKPLLAGYVNVAAPLGVPAQPMSALSLLGVAALQVCCGRSHTLMLTTNGVYAMGGSRHGQLGLGAVCRASPYPRPVPLLAQRRRIVALAAGHHHSAALDRRGRLYTWGWNVFGQCGHGGVDDVHEPREVRTLRHQRLVHVAAGYAHTVAQTHDGRLVVFGCNSYGQLGDGTQNKCRLPRVISLSAPVSAVACGSFTCLMTLACGRLVRWGCDPQSVRLNAQSRRRPRSQLPSSPRLQALTADLPNVREALGSSSSAPETDPRPGTVTPEYRRHLSPSDIPLDEVPGRVRQVAAGTRHVAYLTDAGRLFTQAIGVEPSTTGVTAASETPAAVSALALHELPLPADVSTVERIACGADSILLLTADRAVYAWEVLRFGQVDPARRIEVLPPSGADCSATEKHVFRLAASGACLAARRKTNDQASIAHRLYETLRLFRGCYSSAQLMTKCVALECWGPASCVATLAGDLPAALQYHLRSLSADSVSSEQLACSAAEVLDQYLSVFLEAPLSLHLLNAALKFWTERGLPASSLEQTLTRHWNRVMPVLTEILFVDVKPKQQSQSDWDASLLFKLLSAELCAKLCADVCAQLHLSSFAHLTQRILPADVMRGDENGTLNGSVLADAFICRFLRIHSGPGAVLVAPAGGDPTTSAGSRMHNGSDAVTFRCGHSYNDAEFRSEMSQFRADLENMRRSVPRTAELLLCHYFEPNSCSCNCPACALQLVTSCIPKDSSN